MKINYIILLATALIMTVRSCSDDSVTPTPIQQDDNKEEPELSIMDKIAQEWVLKETFRNGQAETTDGATKYLFTEEGAFFFLMNNDSWEPIGTWEFSVSDSSSIDVLFMGTEDPVNMELKTLTETELKTEFVVNGSTLNYNYVR